MLQIGDSVRLPKSGGRKGAIVALSRSDELCLIRYEKSDAVSSWTPWRDVERIETPPIDSEAKTE